MDLDYGTLRSLLATPSATSFDRILDLAEHVAPGRREDALRYLDERFSPWPAHLRAPSLERTSEALTRSTPWYWQLVRAVTTRDVTISPEDVARWAEDSSVFEHVEHLDLFGTFDASRHITSWGRLKTLSFEGCRVHGDAWPSFLEHTSLPALEQLDVFGTSPVGAYELEALCRNTSLTNLRTLVLSANGSEGEGTLDEECFDALGGATFASSLTSLDLDHNHLWSRSYRGLGALTALRRLNMRGNALGPTAFADALMAPGCFPSLRELRTHIDVGDHTSIHITPDHARRALASGALEGIEVLEVGGLTSLPALDAWRASEPLRGLSRLSLSGDIADVGVMLPAVASRDAPLGHLDLDMSLEGREVDAFVSALDALVPYAGITTLAIRAYGITDACVQALIRHTIWPRLTSLILLDQSFGSHDRALAERLTQSAHRPRVVVDGYTESYAAPFAEVLGPFGFETSFRPFGHDSFRRPLLSNG